jgi:hypothetical protein
MATLTKAQTRTAMTKGTSLTAKEWRKRSIAMKILAMMRKRTQATKLLVAMWINAANQTRMMEP